MSIKFDEKVKLDSFAAHYEILLGNIEAANADLSSLFKSIEENTLVYKQLVNNVQILKDELADLTNKRKLVNQDIEDRIAVVKERESSVAKIEIDSKNELSLLKMERGSLVSDISGKERELHSLNQQIDVMSDSMANMIARVQTLDKALKEASERLTEASRALAETDRVRDMAESNHILKKTEMQAELTEIQKCIEIANSQLINTADYYAKKDAEYKRRESDILVVTARLKRLFNEVRPGTALKI